MYKYSKLFYYPSLGMPSYSATSLTTFQMPWGLNQILNCNYCIESY